MRSIPIFLGLLLIASPAFALGDSIIGFCFTEPDPKACLIKMQEYERKAEAAEQRRQDRQLETQLEAARIQAQGLMLFGSGPALINGMNQGFQNMQQPYVDTPYFSHGNTKK